MIAPTYNKRNSTDSASKHPNLIMTKHNYWQVKILSFLFFTLNICTCYCNCDLAAVEQPAGVDEFIENMSAHYRNELQLIDAEVKKMEFSLSKELSVVAYNQELASKNARQLESRMRSTSSLNMKAKLCIQHFVGNVTLENTNLQTKLRACVDAAKTNSRSLADNAKNQIKNSKVQIHDLFNSDLVACRKTHGNNSQKLSECAREKLRVREINILNMIKAANKDIEANMCKIDGIVNTAQECSFQHILETYSILSENVSNINTCIGERLIEIK